MKLMEFLDKDIEVATAITGSYDPILVTLSFCIVCLAIYSALSIGERARGLTRTHVRKIWLTWGATVLGVGIWAMHFIGMHAFKLPVAVHYDLPLTLLSVIPAIISGGIVLCVACKSHLPRPRLILCGTLVGAGIGLMHYTGMAAMHTGARMAYDLPLFIVSIIVAIVLSIVALYLHHRINYPGDTRVYWSKFASTVVLGLAVSAMHYTAMAATYFFPEAGIPTTAVAVEHALLHTSVSVVTVLIILLAFATTIIDSRLNATAGMKNEIAERHRQTEIVRVKNKIMDNILNGIHDYYFAVERDWRICYANNRARELLKGNSNDILGEVLWDTAPEFASFSYKNLARAMANREEVTFETYYPPENRWFNLRAIPTGDGIAVYLHDITDNKQLIDSLSQSERRFHDFAEVGADWFWEMDENLRFNYFSGRMHQITGIDPVNFIGKTRRDLAQENTNDSKWQAHLADLEAHRPFHDFRYKTQRADGAILNWSTSGKPIYDADGKFTGYRGVSADVTAEFQAKEALQDSEERFKDFAETAADWFWEMDEHLRFSRLEGNFSETMGVPKEYVLGKTRQELYSGQINDPKWVRHFEDMESRRPFTDFEIKWTSPREKTEKIFLINGKPFYDSDGSFRGYRGVGRDITAAHALSTQLTYQASHDTLTGLVNRRELERRLQRALESTKKDSAVHALCYLDLDQFKVVNDTCGHVAGDELLRQLAKVLPKCVRHQDTVARLGGDEFGVLLEHCSKEQALRVAEAMRRMVADFIFIWQDKTFNVGVSIGLVSITQATDNFNTLLSAADNACYAAKDLGRNRIHVYDETEAGMVRRHGDMQWVTRIHEAIEENRFELAFQPIVSVESFSPGQDNGWDHFELLLRMRDKSGKLIAPGAFLPAAERYNLISKLDRWVISTAFHWLARHPTHLKRVDHCSINLSGQSFGNKEFLNFVLGIFKNGGMPPEKICFEITETSAISDLAGAIDFIKALREIGCLFSLDDFGSGLSSFGYLKSLPVDFIKIDGLFVKDIVEDPISYSMVKSINDIGHVMGKKTIAEFVENEAVLSKLREIGVDYAQGYGICKPQPLDELQVAPVRKNLRVIQAR
jgi:diguanylate cyclase (GGDEF)-like protein/PAS domain S-box-containing protein